MSKTVILSKIPCVILCGGRSSRMGEDKSLLPFSNSNSLTQYQYDKLKSNFEEVYISSKIDKFDFLKNKEKYLILDKGEIFSPIVALQTILQTIKAEKVFIITVDTPLVSIDSINELINSSNESEICVAQTLKTHNLCGVFSTSLVKFINEMLITDIHKVNYLLKNNNTKYLDFPNDDEFINLNNKDEYKRALNIISKSNN
ncbi:molybdenum cofactor guanylyltransferase MobA [Poseidonibacter ostreae]|jgi:molybdenum cofactor guanylyltransferase|uniref:Probable molybdenum cofactor guanylyltransferase n=1 Tax=Poseidonibacter ostreae TaxID=2654171 RepID=A0A6L4WY54_9BACT|nr:molybdenum cofactor guanylyltransferase MobA [Poseidonibacter ostreae]KAB7890600.1 molybdenum cofactor guanylyltransferase MobA [Poseidonibacter ostreae]KAB7892416.1 molybdenum cofactor guanylyltransferase MobA [Poseidonibacter ostreae]MAC83458.1 molybdenum cofactor guanylyltransferase [Arcobacter sp.]|tara:strand:+ start:201 stop:803 length:603 start_codon:yes stop_codon:yes gene_type:complete